MNMVKALGLSIDELNLMNYGQVMDMLIEKGNDEVRYKVKATQEDFDRF